MRRNRPALFKGRHFEPEMIILCVRRYLRFCLSYRNVEELMAERNLHVDHVTIWRWVQRYAPELNRRCRPEVRRTNRSWRVDETYLRVAGKWTYLYRAVDSTGATIDFLLSAKRDAVAAKRFLQRALRSLALLEQKTNALDQAAPLQGLVLPEEFAELRRQMEARLGKRGRREYVQVLRVMETFSMAEVGAAVRQAIAMRAIAF